MSIISQIVGRCHVSESNLTVVRYVISKLRHGKKTFRSLSRKDRREMIAECIRHHQANRKLYAQVMGGPR